jgi:hypothetical protein
MILSAIHHRQNPSGSINKTVHPHNLNFFVLNEKMDDKLFRTEHRQSII